MTKAAERLENAAFASKVIMLNVRMDEGLIAELDKAIDDYNRHHETKVNRSVVVRVAIQSFLADLED